MGDGGDGVSVKLLLFFGGGDGGVGGVGVPAVAGAVVVLSL